MQGEFLDIICFNAYEGWYTHAGQLDTIELGIVKVAEGWRKKYKKPVLISEYGADTEEGLHFVSNISKLKGLTLRLLTKISVTIRYVV